MAGVRAAAVAALVASCAPLALAETERVELIPDRRAGWSLTHLLAPVTGLFLGGPGYWFAAREIRVETTPHGADLDLFYVRRGSQKRYEQARAPVTLVLPSRIEADARDTVAIRAMLDGYRRQELTVKVRSRDAVLRIELDPLPNTLVRLAHVGLGERASLEFLTQQALAFRIQQAEGGYSLVLTQTALSPGAGATLAGVRSSLLDSLRARQLGEDLVVRLRLSDRALAAGIDLRSRQGHDPVRGLHVFALDLAPPDGGALAVERARAALARIRSDDVSGCADVFDAALRERLDPADLARALAPRGAFTDPYLRAAMKRLGELSPGGAISLVDGSRYRAAVPLELTAAASQAALARGYLALLRRFVAELDPPEHRRETLRGLVAPELASERFEAALEAAEQRERSCRSSPVSALPTGAAPGRDRRARRAISA